MTGSGVGNRIEEQNALMLRRQEDFRLAAKYVALELAQVPVVEKAVLFGSVAASLAKEVPRFREFHRAGVKIWHECRDVDLAVWVTDLKCLKVLQRARSRALGHLLAERNVGVAHHQVDIFIMETGTNRYLGRLCTFSRCPRDKMECLRPGCGTTPLLQQHKEFPFNPSEALASGRAVVLYDRQSA